MRDLLKIFKALSADIRLRMVDLLIARDDDIKSDIGQEKERCVDEIRIAMHLSPTQTSRNLNILSNAGLLKARRDGPLVFYSLDSKLIKKNCAGLEAVVKQAFEVDQTAQLHRERLKRPASRRTDKEAGM